MMHFALSPIDASACGMSYHHYAVGKMEIKRNETKWIEKVQWITFIERHNTSFNLMCGMVLHHDSVLKGLPNGNFQF